MGFGCMFSYNNSKIKHTRLKEKYGEGKTPFESKTGTCLYY